MSNPLVKNPELRDKQGNLLVSTEQRIDLDAVDVRFTSQMLHQMRMGDAILMTFEPKFGIQLEVVPHYRLYR